jgi:large repetitive protein
MQLRQKLLMGLLLTPLLAVDAQAKGRANHDAFLVSSPNQSPSVAAESLQARGVEAAHMEERLGVPTFLWAQGGGVSSAQVKPGMTLEQAARTHLQAYADAYRLSASDLGSNVELKAVHQTKFGPVIAQFVQRVEGIEVFRNELKVIMRREDLALVALSGYLAPGESVRQARAQAGAFKLSAEQVVARAFQDLTGLALSPRSLVASGKPEGGYTRFALETGTSNLLTWSLGEPPRAKQVYYTLQDRLEPAWYVEVEAGSKGGTETSYFSYVFSASSGALLMRNDLTAHSDFTYRVWADPTSKVPYDGPHGTEVTPHPTGMPDNYDPPFVPANLVTLSSYPFSTNDPWLPAGATQTAGNNADAYADLFPPDGYQEGRDFRATTTGADTFDYTYDPTRAPGFNTTQQQAAVVNLFYMNNFLHDWYYDAGFDEVSGNAQASNYGRGGLGGDALRVEGQDYSGRNNANMSTPADGARPRMQMYIFNGRPRVTLNSPPDLTGDVLVGGASFGASEFNVTADILIPNPAGTTLGCSAFPAGTFTGKIALIDRGTCAFSIKTKNAQDAGAVAVIIANNAPNQPPPGMSGTDATITIPTVSITLEAASTWKTRVAGGATFNLSLARLPDQDTDGTLDNDIIAHEWGHYISNRLISNSSGLVNNQGRAMGEGWADFHSLLLTVRESDRTRPGNEQYQGVYPTAVYTQNGAVSNGSYFGIRRVPYSTSMARNALTLRHTSLGAALPTTHPISTGAPTGTGNSQVHNSGEVWATMLWECYASLLNAYPFQEAQDRMKQYLVAAYKATPASPTYLEARDAVLAAAAASDPADYQRFLQAFAKRGAGLGAKVSDRNTTDHVGVVESYSTGKNLEVVSATLDDGANGCDRDGVLDVNEQGFFTLTVRNTGSVALSGLTGAVTTTSTTATLAFPSGTTLTFPTIQPNATARVRLPVRLNAISSQPASAGLRVTFSDTDLPTPAQVFNHDAQVHYDDALAVSASDSAEGMSAWTSSFYQFRPAWSTQGTASNRYYHADNPAEVVDLTFTTPWLQVNPTGDFILSFAHRYSFEASSGSSSPFYDGGVLEFSLDGIVWFDVLDLGTVDPGYNYTAPLEVGSNPLAERYAYAGLSPGFPNFTARTLNFRELFAGMEVRFRFRVGADESAGAYGWDIDNITFTNVANTPFGARVAETSDGTACNTRPVANAGSNQIVLERIGGTPTTVTLNGTGSFDTEGQALTYRWTQTGGPTVALRNDTSAQAQFEADVPYDTSLTFQLLVNDGVDSSVPATVTVNVVNVNRAPTAAATGPASADEGSVVTLDGSGSSDVDDEALTYAWTQTGGPAVTLTGAATATPSFTTPAVSTNSENVRLTFSLVVRDSLGLDSTPSTFTVRITNVDQNPTANAGTDQAVDARSPVTLSGSGSDPDQDTLAYAWRQVGGTAVTLTGADTATPSFTAPDMRSANPEALTFELTATANGATATDTVVVTVRKANRRPVAQGPNAMQENERTNMTLTASGLDPDDDALGYQWTQTGGPVVQHQGADSPTLTFATPEVLVDTLLTFKVVVTDPDGATSEATVSLMVKDVNRAPAASPRKVAGSREGETITLHANASDADGDTLTYAWRQTAGPSATLATNEDAIITFEAPATDEDVDLTFEVTVTDGKGGSDTKTVQVTVLPDATTPPSGGCASTGHSGPASMAPLLLLALGLLVSRRRLSL